ncbi:aspartate kinase [Helicobacter muridarum]|uniref:Aspartokinase n=1 Tax=Helicobacter muridarum TaxID=216 RepID=A0A099U179_9HELI|nr:aspartate kinase [Helicobacter muridarum]TLE00762.1 aspartate kinase [Helicobacter muridarum]STQ86557.1 aspartokinase [Helicobacter muridarum]
MLIVQKYGGTSMGSSERIQNVANRVSLSLYASYKSHKQYVKDKDNVNRNNKLVVVVSAMSGVTDGILEHAGFFTSTPNERDLDMALSSGEQMSAALLSIALNAKGLKSIALNGRQAGIFTDSNHTKARIQYIDTTNIYKLLDDGYIVVVTGFQGLSNSGEITTLGRGGSDLSAVALAGALKANVCEIYSDVDGVYTTDPRIESKAKKIDRISYDEMLELASMGAKVLLTRSVELAKKLNVPIYARSSFSDDSGTLITTEENIMEKPIVSGIALDKNQARVSLISIQDRPGIAAELFGKLSKANINVDMIVQTIGRDSKTNLDFTVPKNELEKAKNTLNEFDSYADLIDYDNEVAIVSIVGVGMKSHSGVAAKAFQVLAKDNINIRMISTSEIKISMLIDLKYAELSVRVLHAAYKLDQ